MEKTVYKKVKLNLRHLKEFKDLAKEVKNKREDEFSGQRVSAQRVKTWNGVKKLIMKFLCFYHGRNVTRIGSL